MQRRGARSDPDRGLGADVTGKGFLERPNLGALDELGMCQDTLNRRIHLGLDGCVLRLQVHHGNHFRQRWASLGESKNEAYPTGRPQVYHRLAMMPEFCSPLLPPLNKQPAQLGDLRLQLRHLFQGLRRHGRKLACPDHLQFNQAGAARIKLGHQRSCALVALPGKGHTHGVLRSLRGRELSQEVGSRVRASLPGRDCRL